ncbi:MAG: dihydroxyacetone kinase subunit L [Bacteroidota bacterium]
MTTLDNKGLRQVFDHLKKTMDHNRERLIELDSAMGDGDLGITMQKAFTAANTEAQSFKGTDIGKLMLQIGMKIATEAPSTMGTLLARGFMKGGKSIAGIQEMNLDDISSFFDAFMQGIGEAGKTKPGNKTIVDSLNPAVKALRDASLQNKSLIEGLFAAYSAAQEGVESTKNMMAQHGRAAYYGGKSIGTIDAGAVVGELIIYGFYVGANN